VNTPVKENLLIRAVLAAFACLAALGLAEPAAAAGAAPTISAPASRAGYGPITITGTAPAGATVELYESAYVFNDFAPSPDYDHGGFVTTIASSTGRYTLSRLLDSGFRFYVVANGVASNRISVAMGIVPTMTMTASAGTVNVSVTADPTQPGLRVHIQRDTNGTWTDVAGGSTAGSAARFTTTLTGQGTGTRSYRAVIDADPANNLLTGRTPTVAVNLGGGSSTPTPTATLKPGDVQFSRIVYNSPGSDTRSNTSLNAEYVRLTNRTAKTINLRGWTIRDAAGNVYTVRTDQKVGAGSVVYLHTGKGTNGRPDSKHRYWNRTTYIWNNAGDTAYLRAPSGKSIDTCKWGADRGQTFC
jgi:hypothetical protein